VTATVAGAIGAAAARLRAAGVEAPARDARRLMAAALGEEAARLALHAPEPVPEAAAARFEAMVAARARRQPVAQIVGERLFWGRSFRVTPDVLDPRPETETLVAAALEGSPPAALLDLGTGSGALIVTLLAAWTSARGVATDTSTAALAVAAENAARHGVADRVRLVAADWATGVAERFDLVVCNPPYIAEGELAGLAPEVLDWEPRAALTPGPSGLEAYARIAGDLLRLLAPRGRALFEIGAGQGATVRAVFAAAGFRAISVLPDLDGRDRVVEVRTG
jgi:release factor glutamine methyltransferase